MNFYSIVYSIVTPIARFWHLLYNYRSSEKLKEVKTAMFSAWINNDFLTQNGAKITPPITLKKPRQISFGCNVKVGGHAVMTVWGNEVEKGEIIIGSNCNFGEYVNITSYNSIIIGNNVLTGRWVTITDNNHGNTDLDCLKMPPLSRQLVSKGPVIIGDSVWLGDKVVILPGVTIGEGAVVAANSVVTKDVLPYTVVAGVPAKEITKEREK